MTITSSATSAKATTSARLITGGVQPLLRRDGETNDEALNRFLADIKHPLVRHRLVLFRRLLNELIHGTEAKPE